MPDVPDDSIEGLDLDLYADVDRLTEEFRDQLDAPDAKSAATFAAEHPELAAVLLPALRAVETLHKETKPGPSRGPLIPGDHVGRFKIEGELGRGGMGIVYEASEEGLERTVALKVLDSALASDAFKQRFLREARAAARLEHSAIVPVYGTGEDGTLLWYAMRRIDGVPLDLLLHRMSDEAVPKVRESAEHVLLHGFDDASDGDSSASSSSASSSGAPGAPRHIAIARMGQRLASALAYAHSEGVLHRDVKPGNVLVDAHGLAHLTDFGLCKLEGEASLTEASDVIGTLRYLPPEGLHQETDARGDVYALGLVLHELLTRRPAFDRRERARLVHDIERRDPVAPRKVDPTVPQDLERIVLKATAKLPEERYATAEAFAADLGAFLAGKPIQARPLGLWYLLRLTARRHRAATAVAAVSLVTILALGVAYVFQLQGLLHDVDEARREAEHGEAIALLNNVASGVHERQVAVGQRLLMQVVPAERNWAWRHLWERVSTIDSETWIPIQRPTSIVRLDDETLLAWERREVMLCDARTLRRRGSIVSATADDITEEFWGAVPSGEGRGVLIADGKSRAIVRWTGDRMHVPEPLVRLPNIPSLLRAALPVGLGAVVVGNTVLRFRIDDGTVVDVHAPVGERQIRQMEITAGGDIVYGTDNGEVWRYGDDVDAPRRIGLHEAEVSAICVRGDDVVATGDLDGVVRFHPDDARANRRQALAFPTAVWLIAGDDPGTIHVGFQDGTITEIGLDTRVVHHRWSAFTNAPVGVLQRPRADGTIGTFAFANNGKLCELDESQHGGPFAAASSMGPSLRIVASPGDERIALVSHDGFVHAFSQDSAVRVPAENRYATPRFHSDGVTVAQGGLVFDAATAEVALRWWPDTGTVMASRWWGDELDMIVFHEDLQAVGERRPIEVWTWDRSQPATAPVLRTSFPGDVAWITNPQFVVPPDERSVVVTGVMGSVYRVDLETGTVAWTTDPHRNQITAMEYDALRGQLITASKDGAVRVTDIETGAAVPRPDAELDAQASGEGTIMRLALHPSGTLLATTDDRGAVSVWTYPEGREVMTHERPFDAPWCPLFTEDGSWLVFSTQNGGVELLGHGTPPPWAEGDGLRVTVDEMLERALALMQSEPIEAHHVVAAGSVLANIGGLEYAVLGAPGDDPRVVRLRKMLDPYVVPTDLRMFRNRAYDGREFVVGRFGFRDLDAFPR